MEENKNQQVQERTYTQQEVEQIINQLQIKFNTLKKNAEEEIQKRDLSNFYQSLSFLMEITKNANIYSADFMKRVVEHIEKAITYMLNSLDESEKEPENQDNKE